MKKEIAEEWIAELTSGKHQQATETLETSDGRKCCLGVLCRIAERHGVIKAPVLTGSRMVFDGYQQTSLPVKVMEWADMDTSEGYVKKAHTNLSNLNDNGYTFAQIAEVIKENIEAL